MGAQELPPITSYSPSEYGADNQNWQSSQSDDGIIYIANNKGLLSFNGAQWHLNPSPNGTIIRSVKAIGNQIYTGAHMDFGYWEKTDTGILSYTSLKDRLQLAMVEGEQIWKILSYNKKVLFQSLNGIYIYDLVGDTINYIAINKKNAIYRLWEVDDKLLFQIENQGLFILVNGEAVLYSDNILFKEKNIIAVFNRQSDWLVVTEKSGLYTIKDSEVTPWEYEASEYIKDITIYRSIQLSDGAIALGTIANGLITLTEAGSLAYQFTQEKGLGNNTVLSIYEDAKKNIWVGLDNGMACINTEPSIQELSR